MSKRTRNPRPSQMKEIRSIAHEFADICVSVIDTALRHVRKNDLYLDAPDVGCAVLVGRAGNDLNDYFRDHYRHNFQPPHDMEDARELTGHIALMVADVVRRHSKLVLQNMYEDGLEDDDFEELMFADIRSTVMEIVADEYGIQEELEKVKF